MKRLILGSLCLLTCLFFTACTYDQLELVETCDNTLTVSIANQTPSACGIASGSIMAMITGDEAGAPLQFSINNADFQQSPSFTDLAAGSYTITARQGACSAEVVTTVENAEGLNIEATPTAADCGTQNGSITVAFRDATGQVAFSIAGSPAQASPTFTGLAPGTYLITAEDEIGCQVSGEVTVESTVTFTEVEALVTSTCAVSGCHAGNVSPDFRIRDNILSRASRIASRTGSRTMPPPSSGRSLSDQQIEAIACWVADGATE